MSKVRFQDIVKQKDGFLRGPFGGDLKKDIFVEKSCDTYKVYEQGVVLNNDESIGRYYISNDYFKKKMYRFEVKPKDFLVSCSGVNYGAIHQLSENIEKGVINQALLRIRLDSEKVDDNYFYYLFKALIVNMIVGKKGDSTIPNFPPLSVIKALEFELPEKDYQIQIGRLLSHLDNKIELNNRINAELETMAKTLYDYWFVQFDFPDANGKPYKTSGGTLVYNPTLKREIPEGWEASNVLKVAHLLGGGTPTKTKKEYWNGAIPFFTPTDSDKNIFSVETEDYITAEGLKKSSTRLFEPYTVFITARGSVGRLALNAVPMAMNQSCYALRAKDGISYTFLFFLIKELIHHLEVKASGSVFNSIVSNDIEYTNLALPSDTTLMEKYAAIVEPIFEKIESTTKENKKLSSLRDWLLPMLMNGQVTVGEAS